VENLILQGNADLQGYGNGLSNALYGNSGNNPDGFRSSNPTTPASQSGLCGLRRSRCQIPISSLGRSPGCRSAAPRTARGSSGFPGLCRTCVPLEGHRDLLRRLVGSRPRCQVPLADRLSRGGLPKNLIINEAPGILHRLDQSAFIVARRRPGLLVLNLGILQLRGVSGREPG
jgi:hypothetical protein